MLTHLHKKKHLQKKPASSERSERTRLTRSASLASFSERKARPSEARLQVSGRGVPRTFATRSRGKQRTIVWRATRQPAKLVARPGGTRGGDGE